MAYQLPPRLPVIGPSANLTAQLGLHWPRITPRLFIPLLCYEIAHVAIQRVGAANGAARSGPHRSQPAKTWRPSSAASRCISTRRVPWRPLRPIGLASRVGQRRRLVPAGAARRVESRVAAAYRQHHRAAAAVDTPARRAPPRPHRAARQTDCWKAGEGARTRRAPVGHPSQHLASSPIISS